jgi:hypothetical protein
MVPPRLLAWTLFAAASSLLMAVAAIAEPADENHCRVPAELATSPPPTDGGPVKVSVGLHLIDLRAIDDVSRTFQADFIAIATWRDPRLPRSCRLPVDSVWTPQLELANAWNVRTSLAQNVEVGPEGTVRLARRVTGDLTTTLDLREFPFDVHELPIQITAAADDVTFEVTKATHVQDRVDPPGWSIGEIVGRTGSSRGVSLQDPRKLASYPNYVYAIQAERVSSSYLRRAVAPLFLIVAMSFSVSWIDRREKGPRFGIASTSMLTIVAFQFSLQRVLPPVAYLTRLDDFVMGCLVLVFLAFVQAIVTSSVVAADTAPGPSRIDRVARWLAPLAFLALTAYAFL